LLHRSGGVAQTPAAQVPDAQSVPDVQDFPLTHRTLQAPPQSTSASSGPLTPSEQPGAATSQAAQTSPPQSTLVSS
jgi:hypothetical protein